MSCAIAYWTLRPCPTSPFAWQTALRSPSGAMAKVHWQDLRVKAKEAWLYPLGWILYFDDKGVVAMLRRPQQGFLIVE